MYSSGTRFEVVRKITLGNAEFDPGLQGVILQGVPKMVGKAYKVKFDDGRAAEIHVVIMTKHTKILTGEGKGEIPSNYWQK
jgi:hypothetical protein